MKILMLALVPALFLQEEWRGEWSDWSLGTSVTYRVFSKNAKEEKHQVMRMKVARVEAEKVVIKVEELVNGEPAGSQEIDYPTKADNGKKVGTETLDIDGKSIDCTIYEKEMSEKGGKGKLKVWYSRSVPGRIAREEWEMTKDTLTRKGTGQVTKLNQSMVLAGKTLTYCIYERNETKVDGKKETLTRWVTEEVPGFLIKVENRTTLGKAEDITIREAIQFEVK